MEFWIDFWTIFFFASLAIFACLAVVVSIGGFFDIRSLFKSLTNRARLPAARDERQATDEESTG